MELWEGAAAAMQALSLAQVRAGLGVSRQAALGSIPVLTCRHRATSLGPAIYIRLGRCHYSCIKAMRQGWRWQAQALHACAGWLQAQGVAAHRAEVRGTSPALVAALHRGAAGEALSVISSCVSSV